MLLPLGWRRLIVAFGSTITTGQAVRLWSLAQAARYVPTGLLAVTSRLQLAAKAGISKTVTMSSIAIETAVLFAWALLTCALFVPSSTFPSLTRWSSGAAAVIGLATLPWLVPAASTRLSKLKKISVPRTQPRVLCEGIALLGLSVFARALSTVCLAAGYLGLSSSDLPLIVGATYAAVIAGMIGVTPAGLGVREGVITVILAGKFGLTDAAAFALISRAWEFTLEMLFLVAASWWGRQRTAPTQSGLLCGRFGFEEAKEALILLGLATGSLAEASSLQCAFDFAFFYIWTKCDLSVHSPCHDEVLQKYLDQHFVL